MEIKTRTRLAPKKITNKLKSSIGTKIFVDLFENKKIQKTYTGALYQTHTLLDLLDMKLAQEKLKRDEEISFELNTILATYAGHTIFSLYIEEPLVYKQILK